MTILGEMPKVEVRFLTFSWRNFVHIENLLSLSKFVVVTVELLKVEEEDIAEL